MNAELIKKLKENRDAEVVNRDTADAAMRVITDKVAAEKRATLSVEEQSEQDALLTARNASRDLITQIDERIGELAGQDERDAAAAEVFRKYSVDAEARRVSGGANTGAEPEPYVRGSGQSFFLDQYRASKGDAAAHARLERNNAIVMASSAEKRAISTTVGAGGEWVPPLWMENKFITFLRPGRIIADKTNKMPLPAGTNVMYIPKVNTGTAVAAQGTQNTPIQQTDLTTSSISSPVVTLAGGQTIAMQLIEQSPLNIDDIVLADLAADYARAMGVLVVNGLVTAGTAQAWTQGTPTFSGTGSFWNTIQKAIVAMTTTRFQYPSAILMHPRRWAWALAQTDPNGRPYVDPEAVYGPFNASGIQADDPAAQGYVGALAGLPVFVDPNIPVNAGAGTNQDYVFVTRLEDVYLWEGNIRTQAFEQTYAQNLSMFVRLYNYVSLQAARYPSAIQVITGTGAVTPTF